LARGTGADVLEVLRAMAALERAGLADARRLRLTLSGLALAAAFSEPESGGSQSRERRPSRSLAEASAAQPLPRASTHPRHAA
jgi:hypothetical protein